MLKANKALRGMAPGATPDRAGDRPGRASKDFAAFSEETGHELLSPSAEERRRLSASCCAGEARHDRAGTLLLTHRACLQHDPGEYHPECPDRLRAVLRALDDEEFAGLRSAPRRRSPRRSSSPSRTRANYVAAILGIRPGPGERVALDADTLMNHASAEAALRAAGAAVAAVDAVCARRRRAAPSAPPARPATTPSRGGRWASASSPTP